MENCLGGRVDAGLQRGVVIMRIDTHADVFYLILCDDDNVIMRSRSGFRIIGLPIHTMVDLPDRINLDKLAKDLDDIECTSVITDVTGYTCATIKSSNGTVGIRVI